MWCIFLDCWIMFSSLFQTHISVSWNNKEGNSWCRLWSQDRGKKVSGSCCWCLFFLPFFAPIVLLVSGIVCWRLKSRQVTFAWQLMSTFPWLQCECPLQQMSSYKMITWGWVIQVSHLLMVLVSLCSCNILLAFYLSKQVKCLPELFESLESRTSNLVFLFDVWVACS